MDTEKMQKICKFLQRITLMIGIFTIILPIVFWNRIPDVIPSHYNAAGIPDQYSDKGILVFLLFMVALLMGIMSIALYYVKQEMTSKYAKEASASQMGAAYIMLVLMNFSIQCIFAYITYCSATSNELGSFFLIFALILVFDLICIFRVEHQGVISHLFQKICILFDRFYFKNRIAGTVDHNAKHIFHI